MGQRDRDRRQAGHVPAQHDTRRPRVAVVGYTTDKRFILRNSWGTAWGEKGFGYASEAYINAEFYNESYRVTL